MTLVLQTTIAGRIAVWLIENKKILISVNTAVESHASDRVLAVVDLTLRQAKKTINDVQKIVVVRGPGSFTSVRTGLIIANTLGVLLKIPVGGIVTKHQLSDSDVLRQALTVGAREKIVRPWYGKSPNITRPKIKRAQATAKR